jgi:S-adenosylmethionine:tRNA ribosyltransferase-isomerase
MKLSQFKFNLPESLIAHSPSDIRDESRLMVLHRDSGKIEHKIFKDILDYFDDQDVMILNNTKVFRRVCMVTKKRQALPLKCFYCAS